MGEAVGIIALMNNSEKITYLNLFLDVNQRLYQMANEMRGKGISASEIKPSIFALDSFGDELYSKLPKLLYKYRPFDSYTSEMIEQGYLFLCKAS